MAKKYQREIEDILKQAGEMSPAKRASRGSASLSVQFSRYLASLLRDRLSHFSPGRIMFAGVALLLATLLFGSIVSGVVAPLAVAGVILFLVGYGMFFINPRQRYEKRWRGQPIEDDSESSWGRFRRK